MVDAADVIFAIVDFPIFLFYYINVSGILTGSKPINALSHQR